MRLAVKALLAERADCPSVVSEDGPMNAPAVVVAYDPHWPRQFEALRAQADVVLAGVKHRWVSVDRDSGAYLVKFSWTG